MADAFRSLHQAGDFPGADAAAEYASRTVDEFPPATAQELADAQAWRDELEAKGKVQDVPTGKDWGQYQVREFGPHEYQVETFDGAHRAKADGIVVDKGVIGEAKFSAPQAGLKSPYRLDSEVPQFVRDSAAKGTEHTLRNYADIVRDGGHPMRGLEIRVNAPQVVPWIVERLRAVDFPPELARIVVKP